LYFSEYMPTYSPVFLFYNTTLFLLLTLLGGGRYDWAYEWGGVLLGLNALPFFYRLIKHRGRLLGRGPLFWLLGILLPWITFGGLFYAAQYNPSHELLFPNNLFSPLIPLEHVTLIPTTPNPERSRLFLIFLLGLLCLPLNILTAPIKRKTIRSCMGLIVITAALLAISGAVMKLTGNPKLLGIIELREPIAFGSFFYKNHWAYFALLAAGCGMGLFHSIYARERATGHFPEKSVGIALLVLILLISIPLAEARATSIAAAPLALAFVFSIFAPLRRLFPRRFILLCALSFCGISIMLYTVAKPQLYRSIARSERQIEATEQEDYRIVKRIALYRDSWQMHKARPLWGWGVGSFIHIHPIYAGDEFYRKNSDYPIAYEFTHSDPLQRLVEYGIAGCALLFSPCLILTLGLRRQVVSNRISLWLLGACLGVLLASFVDMTFTAPAIATGFMLCASAAGRYGIETRKLKA
jgi:putative inorganic carbon (HCO3(-)) transporter